MSDIIHANIGADDVTLSGTLTIPGQLITGFDPGVSMKPDSAIGARRPTQAPPSSASPGSTGAAPLESEYQDRPAQVIVRDGYTVTRAPVVKLSDLARFRPTPGVAHMEPNGWTVVGLATNFFVTAPAQIQSGVLLGRTASVRFTPVSFHWDYGDGLSLTRAVRGSSWVSQSLREFTPTSTSHVYRDPGRYSIALTIVFAAEYKYAGMEWTRIAGSLSSSANQLVVIVSKAKTVLVAQDCVAGSGGFGC